MSDHTNNEEFFLGVLALKEGQWMPHRKFGGDLFGSALMFAEELDKSGDVDAVKVMRIPNTGSGTQKEMWVSPRLKARLDAEAAKKVRSGVQKTQENLAAARKASLGPQ